eukprot:TRINITY_DN5906_c1_g1_i1.p1 TRINITY_DN5906_c1_g1~~TRINITY_DN5906_c1_g1_i1.p1  ORF type:complete len:466 (+),score=90.09 TRINITY_DN5906_c1_g1_i1:111-1400(+)
MGCGSSTSQSLRPIMVHVRSSIDVSSPQERYAEVKSLRTSRVSTDTEVSEAAITAESMSTFVSKRDSFDGVDGEKLSAGMDDSDSGCSQCSKGSKDSKDSYGSSPSELLLQSPRVYKARQRRAVKQNRSLVSLEYGSVSSPRSYGSAKSLARLSHTTYSSRYSSKNLTATCPTSPGTASTKSPSLNRIMSRGTLYSATASTHRVVHTKSHSTRSMSMDRLMCLYAVTGSQVLSKLPIDVKEYLMQFMQVYHFVKCNNTLLIERNRALVQKWIPDDAVDDVWMEPLVKIMPGVPKGRAGRVCLKQCHAPQSFNTFGAVSDDLLPLMGSNNLSSSTVYAECSNTGALSWWSDGKKCSEENVHMERGCTYTITIDNTQSPAEVNIVVANPSGEILASHTEKIYGMEPDSIVYAAAYLFDEGEAVELCPCPQP